MNWLVERRKIDAELVHRPVNRACEGLYPPLTFTHGRESHNTLDTLDVVKGRQQG
jgi:hypothetical protein